MLSKVLTLIPRRYHAIKTANERLADHFRRKINKTQNPLEALVEKYKDRLLYNTVIASRTPGFVEKKIQETKTKKLEEIVRSNQPLPVFLKYLDRQNDRETVEKIKEEKSEPQVTHFPFSDSSASSINLQSQEDAPEAEKNDSLADITEAEVKEKQKLFSEASFSKWMNDYEGYDDSEVEETETWKVNYGTPDPRSQISNVPCGGCGSLLHCRDTSIPGYLPSEIYKNCFSEGEEELKSIICQRCYFLKNHNLALQVRVSPSDYPQVLETIRAKKALVILMIDLLDFPGSIWPSMSKLIGEEKQVIVVGNKVDLIPVDPGQYLQYIKRQLREKVIERMADENCRMNIKDVCLISSKSGFGVEELVTKIHNIWQYRGDIYLVGCTNVGKSTLFNTLLQSDLCKIQAVDLVQRATTSVWPGTTLNLLKFPVLRPSGWRLYARTMRLQSMQRLKAQERKLAKFNRLKNNTSILDMVDRTFQLDKASQVVQDPDFFVSSTNESNPARLGIDEKDPLYSKSKWCYDTPGVVHSDQLIHLLTTEELLLTLPKERIQPRTFNIRIGQTLFIAGIARLDYLEGPTSALMTVYASSNLPITICNTAEAEELYKELLGTDLLKVPTGTQERLSQWPNLQPTSLTISAKQTKEACSDIVLSSAGWIAVTSQDISEMTFKGWTPESRGVFRRNPLLRYGAYTRGTKLPKGPAYMNDKLFTSKL